MFLARFAGCLLGLLRKLLLLLTFYSRGEPRDKIQLGRFLVWSGCVSKNSFLLCLSYMTIKFNRLRWLSTHLLYDPSFCLSTVSRRRSFPVAASILCNSLLLNVQSSLSVCLPSMSLKTFLFQKSFPELLLWQFVSLLFYTLVNFVMVSTF